KSDLKLVRPFAIRLLKINEKELDRYMGEVEEKLLEETDYELELRRSVEISQACQDIDGLFFPNYYPELSSERIITMDWLDGMHLKEFLKTDPSQEVKNKIGQALWDFYHHQIHNLRKVHADPHPGNFLMREDGTLGIIDFGCIKVIPEFFYDRYFALIRKDMLAEDGNEDINKIFEELEFLVPEDSPKDRKLFTGIFKEMIGLLGRPFHADRFDFSDDAYFKQIFDLGERIGNMEEVRNNKAARGSRHGLYINRTYFGLYNILNDLKAEITTTKPEWLEVTVES
ncbi:MAG: lipopolysaccharide core heptose(II) kinase RfaY, partial [Cyclobacteriaceae bacterium]